LYSHSGQIKDIDSKGIVYYKVDTSKGNIGSPGFGTICEPLDDIESFPVYLVHTNESEDSLNAGQSFNEEILEFMTNAYINNL